jgi:hypothetical protein
MINYVNGQFFLLYANEVPKVACAANKYLNYCQSAIYFIYPDTDKKGWPNISGLRQPFLIMVRDGT